MVRLLLLAAVLVTLYLWLRPPTRSAWWRSKKLPLVGVALFAVAYLASPIDVVPDFSPLGLLDDLIVLITAALWIRQQWRQLSRPEPAADRAPAAEGWDPYRVLDVARGATPDEIARAYRLQMKRYHPDRVSDLGDELQAVAHRKTLEIQHAYAELMKGEA